MENKNLPHPLVVSIWLYHKLLILYPHGYPFREVVEATFEEDCQTAYVKGWLPLLQVCLLQLDDGLWNFCDEWVKVMLRVWWAGVVGHADNNTTQANANTDDFPDEGDTYYKSNDFPNERYTYYNTDDFPNEGDAYYKSDDFPNERGIYYKSAGGAIIALVLSSTTSHDFPNKRGIYYKSPNATISIIF